MGAAAAPAAIPFRRKFLQHAAWLAAWHDRTGEHWNHAPEVLFDRFIPWLAGRRAQPTAYAIVLLIFRATAGCSPRYPEWAYIGSLDELADKLGASRGTIRDAFNWLRDHALIQQRSAGRSLEFRILWDGVAKLDPPQNETAADETSSKPDAGEAARAVTIPDGKSRRTTFAEPDGKKSVHVTTNKSGLEIGATVRRRGGTYETVIERNQAAAAADQDQLLEVVEPLFLRLEGKRIDAKHRAAIAARLNGTPPRYFLHTLQRKLQSGRKLGSGLWPLIAGESAEAWNKLSGAQRAPFLYSEPVAATNTQTRPYPAGPAEEPTFADPIRAELQRRLTPAQYQNHFTVSRIVGWEDSEVILWLPDELSRQLIEFDDKVLSILTDAAGAKLTRLIVGDS